MLKKLLVLAAVILVVSCKSKAVDPESTEPVTNNEDDFIIDDTKAEDVIPASENFEVVPDEKAAEQVNQQTEKQIEEVEVKDRVFFGYDSSDVDTEGKKVLDTQSAWLKSDPNIKILVEGHCDERGTREYNIALGEKRALAVKNYLVANGVAESRIKTISYGKEKPAFIGSTEDIWAKNRRSVTIIEQ